MNNTTTVTDESLKLLTNTPVIAKHMNGRVISGTLTEKDGSYTIKLGVQHLQVSSSTLKSIKKQF